MFWFVMYVNESIESTHRERVRFQGSNFVALFIFLKKLYFSSCSRFGAHIVSTVILTNYECTHKATRQNVWNGFHWQSKIRPPICAPFGTKSVAKPHPLDLVPVAACLLNTQLAPLHGVLSYVIIWTSQHFQNIIYIYQTPLLDSDREQRPVCL